MIRLETHFWECYGSQINENDNKFTSYWYIYICQKKKEKEINVIWVAQEKLPYHLRAPSHKKSPAKIGRSMLVNRI